MIFGFTPLEFVCNLLFYSEFCLFIRAVLTPRFGRVTTLISNLFFVIFALLGSVLSAKMSLMRVLTLPVILMGYNLLFYRDKHLRCIFVAWLVPVIIFLSEIIVLATIYNHEMLQARLHEAPMDEQLLCWGVEMISAGILYWAVSLVLNRVRNRFRVREMLMYVFFPVSQFLLLYGWINTSRQLGQSTQQQLLILGVLVLCLVADAGLFASMILVSRQRVLEQENQFLSAQMEAQFTHYKDLTAQYQSIRAMRHDIAKHVDAINALIAGGRNEEAVVYVSELREMDYDRSLGICEHPTVDAYIYSAIHKGEENGITLDAVLSLPADIPIAAPDLVCTYGNLLDNAFEACVGMEAPVITLRTGVYGDFLVISMENPVGGCEGRKEPICGLERGIGMRVLRNFAHKYNGAFRYSMDNGVFRTEITYQMKG